MDEKIRKVLKELVKYGIMKKSRAIEIFGGQEY